MARPLRLEYAGAWYHVMNRGLSRQTIFHNPESYQLFLQLLEDASNRYQIQIHAYCLMKNHYHLLVHTPLPNLGRAMRHIDGVYTIKSNRLIGRDGPLFRGRYKAILVEAENYLLEVSRYIHLNPCAAKIVKLPEDFPWSSYKYFLNGTGPNWLCCDATLNYFSENKICDYRRFVIEGIGHEVADLKTEGLPILGSEDFIKKVKEEVINPLPVHAIPEQRKLLKKFSWQVSDVINAVASYYKITVEEIINGGHDRNQSRNIAIYLCYQLTNNSFNALTKEFKKLSVAGLSKIHGKVELQMKKDLTLKNDCEHIKNDLSKVET